jgi:uncharacterized protein (TIGR02996 family)
MPRSLPHGSSTEGALWTAIAANPAEDTPVLVLADQRDEEGEGATAALLRSSVHADITRLGLVRGAIPTERESESLLAAFGNLAHPNEFLPPPALAAFRHRLSDLLAFPALSPDLRTPEGLKRQYHARLALLQSLHLLETNDAQQYGITGIDGQFHAVPTLAMLEERLQKAEIKEALGQGFTELVLVPFAASFPEKFLPAFEEGLRRNAHLLQPGLDNARPVYCWDEYKDQAQILYHPGNFSDPTTARSKGRLLQEGEAWQVRLVEPFTEIPREGEGKPVGGRLQVECNSTPIQYAQRLQKHETGWTPELYVLQFLQTLEARGQTLDRETYTYCIDALLASGGVPGACWGPDGRRAHLFRDFPENRDPSGGARVAVRVI